MALAIMNYRAIILAGLAVVVAGCASPGDRIFNRGIASGIYVSKHTVPEITDGSAEVQDEIHVVMQSNTKFKFRIRTIGIYLDVCELNGSAKRNHDGSYIYTEAACQLRFLNTGSDLILEVSSAAGERWCHVAETEETSCGGRALIESGTYVREKGNPNLEPWK